MGETLDHLEKVIRDIPKGSFTVEPTNHIEKVIQEVGQEIAESQGGGGELYEHNIFINNSNQSVYVKVTIINDDETPFTNNDLVKYLKDNGHVSFPTGIECGGYSSNQSSNLWSLYAIDNDMWTICKYNATISLPSNYNTIVDTVVQILGGE